MNLFQYGDFVSHAGKELKWKIECDALTDDDWDCLAQIVADRCNFGSVYGIPRGGVKFAQALEKYKKPTNPFRLVVDDVYTTGKSMREAMLPGDFGFVVFARKQVYYDPEKYVRAIFTMDIV